MTYQPATAIEAHAWGARVGAVAQDPDTGYYAFEYDPAWIATGRELAPLRMPLGEGVREFPELSPETYYHLPALLADSLPDAFGNVLVNHWMRTQGIRAEDITPLDRLAYAADRTMGAITYAPPAAPTEQPPSTVELAELVTAARATVNGTLDETGAQHALLQLINVGSSAGGARAKALIAFNPSTSEIRSGHGDAPAGFEHWLIKLDGTGASSLDGHTDGLGDGAAYGRIEYAYQLMAEAAGITMTPARLFEEHGRAHFLTKRFDRGDHGERLHMATLCGLDHLDYRQAGAHSYDQLLDAITRLGLSGPDLAQAYRRMAFNVAAVNRDDHTKNLSFILPEDGAWALSPAYDVTHSYNPIGEWTQRHQMSVNARTENITIADLHAVGERHNVPGYRALTREVREAVRAWPDYAKMAGVPSRDAQRITKDIEQMWPPGL